jgi:hypothetical protein
VRTGVVVVVVCFYFLFFTAAVKLPRQPIISWLCARTVKETLRSHIFLTI